MVDGAPWNTSTQGDKMFFSTYIDCLKLCKYIEKENYVSILYQKKKLQK
jgi:hypothetical protein